MYQRLIEEYLTHYQPELKADLLRQGMLPGYLESQNAAMWEARLQIIERMRQETPDISQLQREMEADQLVREMFLPLP